MNNNNNPIPYTQPTTPSVSRPGQIVRGTAMIGAVLLAFAAGIFWNNIFSGSKHQHDAAESKPASTQATGETRQLWTCSMHPQVIRDEPGICPICHMALEPVKSPAAADSAAADGKRKIKYWWDPMVGASSISNQPGKSEMGMDLVPVYEDEISAGPTVAIDPVMVQNMGVRVIRVSDGMLTRTIRAVGYLKQAEPNVVDVNLRVSGWIEKLHANTAGMHLHRNRPLFDLYSPELQVAVEELIAARRAKEAVGPDADELSIKTADNLYQSVERKLILWGISPDEVNRLAALDQAPRTVTFFSPIEGHVTEKNVVEGSAVKAGRRVLQMVDHRTLWLDLQIYEQDMPFIKRAQYVTATVESVPGKEFSGDVIFIHPHVDPMTRTAEARVALENPTMQLRPGMYAMAEIITEYSETATPLVPREAVIDSGDRKIVFVSLGNGRYEPRHINTGASGDDGLIQVLRGLAFNETVVVSGQFLLDSESRLQEAIQKMKADRLESDKARNFQPGQTVMQMDASSSPAANEMQADAPQTWRSQVDATTAAYLELAKILGATQQTPDPLNPGDLIAASEALIGAAQNDSQNTLARNILKTARALVDKPIDEQRKFFEPLSGAMIALADQSPPSQAIAPKLFVMHCPMVKSSWLQITEKIANPYYAAEMKECGEIKRTIGTISANSN